MTDVLLAIEDGVAEVRINRPHRRNAFHAEMDLARSIANRNPEAVGSVVRLLRAGRPKLDLAALIAERTEMHRNIGSDYQREAVAAAREGRDPVFH